MVDLEQHSIGEKYWVDIKPTYYSFLQFFMLFLVIPVVIVSLVFGFAWLMTLIHNEYIPHSVEFTIFGILFLLVMFIVFRIVDGFLYLFDKYFLLQDILIIQDNELFFTKRENIPFDMISEYYVREYYRRRKGSKTKTKNIKDYKLYLRTEQDYYIELQDAISPNRNKQFAKHICSVIDEWKNANVKVN